MSKPTDLVQGMLDLLILKVIALQMSGEVLPVGQRALYPCLHNRRAKYYTLTKAGRKVLEQETAQWERLSGAISTMVCA